jgi:hypothetical protein
MEDFYGTLFYTTKIIDGKIYALTGNNNLIIYSHLCGERNEKTILLKTSDFIDRIKKNCEYLNSTQSNFKNTPIFQNIGKTGETIYSWLGGLKK